MSKISCVTASDVNKAVSFKTKTKTETSTFKTKTKSKIPQFKTMTKTSAFCNCQCTVIQILKVINEQRSMTMLKVAIYMYAHFQTAVA